MQRFFKKGLESLASLLPWILLALIFVFLAIVFASGQFENLKKAIIDFFSPLLGG
jgi:hypothetical protein